MANGKTKAKAKKIISSPLPFTFKGNDNITYKITPTEKSFCKAFLETNGNGTQAALLAFDIPNKELCKFPYSMLNAEDKKKRRLAENSAASMARHYIRKVQNIKYIDYLLDQYGFTDDKVKLEHFKLMNQDKSLADKARGVEMYYKIKGKFEDKGNEGEIKEFFEGIRNLVKEYEHKGQHDRSA
ncbi:hypothetical protein FJY90_03895 [Candidatus Gottesmanbacteria bacterium]|nr:hypothetical protein [Candidatus Gottesmanbacteria bacterium]